MSRECPPTPSLDDKYLTLRQLSSTLFGHLLLAKDLADGKVVAVKVTNKQRFEALKSNNDPHLSGVCDDWRQELAVNSKLGNSLRSLGLKSVDFPVVEFIEHFEDEVNVYMVTEYVSHGDLYHYMKRKNRLSEDVAKRIFFQMCRSIRRLHTCGYAHLDISLENVLLAEGGAVKLCDLAVATEIVLSGPEKGKICDKHAAPDFRPGKELYRAPEIQSPSLFEDQDDNTGIDGCAADAYSAGVVLFCILFGLHPYQRGCTTDSVYAMIVEGKSFSDVLEVLDVRHEVSPAAENLLSSLVCLKKNRMSLKSVFSHPWLQSVSLRSSKSAGNLVKIETGV